jgi:hypothetical protein
MKVSAVARLGRLIARRMRSGARRDFEMTKSNR